MFTTDNGNVMFMSGKGYVENHLKIARGEFCISQ